MLKITPGCDCPHCALAKAAEDWRTSPAADEYVQDQREAHPERLLEYTDEMVKRRGLVQGLAVALTFLLAEETEPAFSDDLIQGFNSAVVAAKTLTTAVPFDGIGDPQGSA